MFKRICKKRNAVAALLAIVGLMLAGCTSSSNDKNQKAQQKTTEQAASKLTKAEPYPLNLMNDSDERANLRERLLRMNNPNKIGYLYEITQNGQVLARYTIKGKVSSTDSELTNTQNIDNRYNDTVVVEAPDDDGSYGQEEGGPNGIFFFTTGGVLVEWNGLWQYSDAPLNLTSKPLITIDGNAKPSTDAGQLPKK